MLEQMDLTESSWPGPGSWSRCSVDACAVADAIVHAGGRRLAARAFSFQAEGQEGQEEKETRQEGAAQSEEEEPAKKKKAAKKKRRR